MRFIKYLTLFFLVLVSCEEEVFNNKDATLDSAKISNCSEVINRLEVCLDIHEGALSYLEQSCSEETVKFVKENVDSCERLVDYFIEM
tara:strand:- start:219 stop:482 length:264 start_codon:yes stop_codon:yes gene_type:complete